MSEHLEAIRGNGMTSLAIEALSDVGQALRELAQQDDNAPACVWAEYDNGRGGMARLTNGGQPLTVSEAKAMLTPEPIDYEEGAGVLQT